jgi:hypothetical protein
LSVGSIKQYLVNNHNDIIKLLEQSGFYHLSFNHFKNEVRCANYLHGNPTSVRINCETLGCISFSTDITGDIISLIMKHNEWEYNYTLSHIQEVLGISFDAHIAINPLFGGFYKGITRIYNNEILDDDNYPHETLNGFIDAPNTRFFKDNIDVETQYKFNIGFDQITQRITVPWFNIKGQLLGVTGRYNFNDCGEHPKWKSVCNFKKGSALYGIYENYQDIKNKGYVIIGESEKFVMQANTYGYNNTLAIGGCILTDKQIQIIKSLPINKIILAFDEGLDANHILRQADKLKGGIFNTKDIYIIYDINHSILKKSSKNSPTDLGRENFEKLLKEHCYRKE